MVTLMFVLGAFHQGRLVPLRLHGRGLVSDATGQVGMLQGHEVSSPRRNICGVKAPQAGARNSARNARQPEWIRGGGET